MEDTSNLDEATVLGYFETLRSTFVLKFLLISTHSYERDGALRLSYSSFPPSHRDQAISMFQDEKTLFEGEEMGSTVRFVYY